MRRKVASRQELGFTLFELMVVMFLTGAILFTVAKLVSRSLESLKFLQEKNQTMRSATLGCERVASELREAIRPPTITSGTVSFAKVRPGAKEAVGNNYEDLTVPAENWHRDYGSSDLATITYKSNPNGQLVRTVEAQSDTVATNVSGFVVAPAAGAGCYTVTLSITEKRRVVVFKTALTCPALQGAYSP